jgi:serine/threonine protein kinase
VSRALNYLHCHDPRGPAFHRDVKSANIVLNLGLSPKIIDCGLSKFIPEQNRLGTIMSTHGVFKIGSTHVPGRAQGTCVEPILNLHISKPSPRSTPLALYSLS